MMKFCFLSRSYQLRNWWRANSKTTSSSSNGSRSSSTRTSTERSTTRLRRATVFHWSPRREKRRPWCHRATWPSQSRSRLLGPLQHQPRPLLPPLRHLLIRSLSSLSPLSLLQPQLPRLRLALQFLPHFFFPLTTIKGFSKFYREIMIRS